MAADQKQSEKQPEKQSVEDLIRDFKIEPTVSIKGSSGGPSNESAKGQEPVIPTSNSDAVQFTARPMYSSSYNPIHQRRAKAIQAIYQFLEEENLSLSLHKLQQETLKSIDAVSDSPSSRIPYDTSSVTEFGVLLEALDLREAYHSAQSKSSNDTVKYQEMLKQRSKSTEKPCTRLLYQFHGIHKSNILCIDLFYWNQSMYIISGVATRSLMVLSAKNIFNRTASKPDEYDLETNDVEECSDRIVSELNGLTGPPLYIDVDPKWRRFAFVTCMDGAVYVIDLHSAIESPKQWVFQRLKDHKKYVVIGRWSKNSRYLLTAGHDNKATLYRFERSTESETKSNDDADSNEQQTFSVNGDGTNSKMTKLHQYECGGCVEAICWIADCEFVISVRNSAHLEYYRIDEQSDSNLNGNDIGALSYLQPMIKCNVNAFGDQHVSFSIGDIRVSRDGHYILAKTDHEKVLLMIAKTEETLNTFYGSHSDLYSYTRCSFSAEEKFVYASHHNDYVVWDTVTGKVIYRQSNAHSKTLRDMCLDRKHGVIVTTSFDRTIKIWAP